MKVKESGKAGWRAHSIKVRKSDAHDAYSLMAEINMAVLKKYREVNKHGYPMRIDEFKRVKAYPQAPEVIWKNIVDQMIEAFEIICDEDMSRSGIEQAKVKIGLSLYAEYFECIWD